MSRDVRNLKGNPQISVISGLGFQDHRHRPLGHPSRLRKRTTPSLLRRGSPKRRTGNGGRGEIQA